MNDERPIDPNHLQTRGMLRMVGPIVAGVGALFLAVGLVDFFSSMDRMQGPSLFWCNFVGLPLLFVGGSMCMFGFMGAIARYQAEEISPVGKDLFNDMAEGTQTGVRTTAAALGEGLARGIRDAAGQPSCPQCGCRNDADARFCKQCGRALAGVKSCANCRSENPIDAMFCVHCGTALRA